MSFFAQRSVVSTTSALAFGTPLPIWPADHLRQMNWLVNGWAHYYGPLPLELYAQVISHLAGLGFGRDAGPVESMAHEIRSIQ